MILVYPHLPQVSSLNTHLKAIYGFVMLNSIGLLGVTLLVDFDKENNFMLLKLILGVGSNFMITMFFPFQYTYFNELHPTEYRQRFIALVRSGFSFLKSWRKIIENVEI